MEFSRIASLSETQIISSAHWDVMEKDAQLLEAQATIKRLEEQLSKTETDKGQYIELEKNVEMCRNQYEAEKRKTEILHKQLKYLTDKEDEMTEHIAELKETIESQRHAFEKKILAIQRQCQNLEIELDETKNEKNSLSETYSAEIKKLSSELQIAYSELEMSKEQVTLLTEQVQELTQCAQLAETYHRELLITQQKLKDTEDKLNSQQEASILARAMYSELSRLPELEKENSCLKEENQILRESGNRTLLLQEQLATANERYRFLEQSYQELLALQSEHEATKRALEAWEAVGNTGNGRSSPGEVSHQIAELQKNELQLTEKVGDLTSSIHALEHVKQKLEVKNKSFANEIETLKQKNEEHIASIRRLQKRLLLIIKERDSYKRIIESYEQEVTVNVSAVQQEHVRTLEEAIEGYQNLIQKLENDIKEIRSKFEGSKLQESRDKDNESSLETVGLLKNQISKQQEHIVHLEREKNLLLQELETRRKALEPEYELKVLHFTGNPFDRAVQQRIQDMQKLKEENQMLLARVKILEEAKTHPEDVTEQVQVQIEKAASLPSMESLQEQLTSAEIKNKRLMEAFKKTSQEFREASYLLTGYKIDIQPQMKYKLSHMYAETSSDYLLFEKTPEGDLHLLETPYSHKVSNIIKTYLHGHDSIPAFLSSITLDLFSRQTLISMDTSQH